MIFFIASSPSDCHPALVAGSRAKTIDENYNPRSPLKAGMTTSLCIKNNRVDCNHKRRG